MNIIFKRFFLFFLLAICFILFSSKKVIAAEEQNHKSLVTLGDDEIMMDSIKSKIVACAELRNRIVSYIDRIYYLNDCKLRPVKNSEIVNKFVQIRKKHIVNLSSEVFSLIPIGENYTYDDYYNDFEKKNTINFKYLCQNYDKSILTSDSIIYYYIDNCKRRPFSKYSDVLKFSEKSRPIYTLAPQILGEFPIGNAIVVEKTNLIVNESEEIIKRNLPSPQKLCGSLNRKVVTFHESYYFIEDCHLFKIKDLTLEIQRKADTKGGIEELTVKQKLGIPEGEEINAAEVLKKLR
ncbi:hypothetical protein [Fluviispira sanaruensis]|uniref:Uncharacterized protein n=1 Tax=Fluviispira sanaruensis TaxID=2493639 RepID=A0A4P2W003_FLUSA|nr:hypothetical protein [Fluviispira sanaruensis]BBH54472.1 hypothetical protein JCM31447_29430 [Fluviispira sanaruensis]